MKAIALYFGLACMFAGVPHAAEAKVTKYELNIPRQSMDAALSEFSRVTGLQVARMSDQGISNEQVGPLRGTFEPKLAIESLLKDTDLKFEFLNERMVRVYSTKGGRGAARPGAESTSWNAGNEVDQPTQSSAAAGSGGQVQSSSSSASSSSTSASSSASNDGLQEIVVTAQKRTENVLKIPSSISTISGERLETLQVNSLSDLASFVPGMSVTSGGAPGYRLIELRGLSSNYYPTAGPLVGTYLDDLPVGDSTNNARGALFGLDLNPYDIERVEVLKGPQGTLYGANTMGGLIKYVLKRPDLDHFDVLAGVETGETDGSGRLNWGLRGSVNLPIVNDELAVRISGFKKYNAGYIDNVQTGERDINHSTETGGRATLLWQPNNEISIRANVLAQDSNAANMTAVTLNGTTLDPEYGQNKVSTYFSQPLTQQTRLYSLDADWNLGFATLTSSTGWSRVTTHQESDDSGAYGGFCQPNSLGAGWPGCPDYPYPNALTPFFLVLKASKFVEEVRLTSPADQRFQWLVGGYYTKEDTFNVQFLPTFTHQYVPLPTADLMYDQVGTAYYKEPAGFGNFSFQFNDRFDVGAGVRYSAYSQGTCPGTQYGLLGGVLGECSANPSQGIVLWAGTARFHFDNDSLIYARVATGYRAGSGCPACGIAVLNLPGISKPDRTTNYEVGYKGTAFDQRLMTELSAFYIKWSDIQVTEFVDGEGVPINGGTAVSKGFEFTSNFRVSSNLSLGATLGYTDAYLTQDIPEDGGVSGDRLPGSPLWTASLMLDYTHPLNDRMTLLAGSAYRYKDAVVNQFDHSGAPYPIGPQNLVDVYGGLKLSDFTVRLAGNNIFNNRSYAGLLFVADPTKPLFVPVQPRTITLGLDYHFAP